MLFPEDSSPPPLIERILITSIDYADFEYNGPPALVAATAGPAEAWDALHRAAQQRNNTLEEVISFTMRRVTSYSGSGNPTTTEAIPEHLSSIYPAGRLLSPNHQSKMNGI